MYGNLFKGKKAAIFDMDGTIILSLGCWDEALMSVAKEINAAWITPGYHYPKELCTCDRWNHIIENAVGFETEFTAEELTKKTKEAFFELCELETVAGLWPLLVELKQDKGMKLILASNSDRDVVDGVIKKLEMESIFDHVVGGDEVEKRKPDPSIYAACTTKLGLKKDEILVFEDSVTGATAARKADLDTIIIWTSDTGQEKYPKGVKMFSSDFEGFAGNLDKSGKEIVEEAVKE